jgi:peptide deformylase
MILPIKKIPDPVLRAKTEPVTFPLSAEIKKLTKDMFDTVKAADGIGLAAPQVGKSVKLIVINLGKANVPLFALYNPEKTGMVSVTDAVSCCIHPVLRSFAQKLNL